MQQRYIDHAWVLATIFAVLFLAIVTAMSERDEEARIADAAMNDQRLPKALKRLHCPPPDEPLEKLLVTIGSQADGKAPELHCTYVSADLGVIPRIRHSAPQFAGIR